MIDNNYLTLYKTDFYEVRTYFLSSDINNKQLIDFETIFSYANLLYIESKNCFEIIDDNITIVNDSNIIYDIINLYPDAYDMLKEVYKTEKVTYTGKKITYLEVALMVCEEHLKKINDVIRK